MMAFHQAGVIVFVWHRTAGVMCGYVLGGRCSVYVNVYNISHVHVWSLGFSQNCVYLTRCAVMCA